jgi:hypothetical protein
LPGHPPNRLRLLFLRVVHLLNSVGVIVIEVVFVDVVLINALFFDTDDVRPGLARDALERVGSVEFVPLGPVLIPLRVVHGDVLLEFV